MPERLTQIFRHPVKGIGSEALRAAMLSPEGAMAGDRAWALLSSAAPDTEAWQPRRNFLQVASGPGLARVTAATQGDKIRLSHPDRPDLTLDPDAPEQALAPWVEGIWPKERPAPGRLVRAEGHGMTDMPEPYVSVGNMSSLRALSERAGRTLDPRRFRINLWIEGLAPWEEFDLLGETFTIGAVPLTAAERIGRCRAPEADPATGLRNVNVCRVLEDGWGHTDFGIYVRVAEAGEVRVDDVVTLPWS